MAKFRGNAEDWLDDEKSKKASTSLRPKKKNLGRSWLDFLKEGEANGLVVEIFPNQCAVKLDADPHKTVLCSYRRFILSQSETLEKTPVAVGDRVLVNTDSNTTRVIEGVVQRRNKLVRPASGRDSLQHVIASNIDQLCIVASVLEPDFSPGFVDRFLIAAEAQKIPVLICLTKQDLLDAGNLNKNYLEPLAWDIYQKIPYPLYFVSAQKNTGIEILLQEVKNKTVVFCGHSGVGKTSLLRALLKKEIGRVGAVNAYTGKGRHTTTNATLLEGPENSRWIDTPGVRAFGLEGVTQGNLAEFFPEFRELPCQKENCLHEQEKGCPAQELARYESYCRIFESLK